MLDDRWHETERGKVVRSYFHVPGAVREMQIAQEHGWAVQEVKINGVTLPGADERPGLRQRWRTRLVRESDGTVRLNARRSTADVWDHSARTRKGPNVEVTYVR